MTKIGHSFMDTAMVDTAALDNNCSDDKLPICSVTLNSNYNSL